ncbi:hypothetical protein CONCODRAFT_167772 [Conidiobolus coronatus NRRL 28638]|uniref:F-box domain-containing protein n=1 Tax=Conidiobolus coronatus (strain ATCC 28846 / CBS 209.66 / NRRL 28638) TaxID=796925 RepID=A0A137NWJ3_CONC2|nr:hypothetical protein CONCODRAFT_167772 [Conidiobolus coronatus NRRL 28638]|eukprot:KXN67127.1 hypothetical protein CONCODRAFT_167772 [Conidiobolus coronatus NRRL 28638]
MSAINWSYIFKLKEFKNYFDNRDLTQLSMVSKNFRTSLKSTIFESFNFRNLVNMKDYKSCIISEDNDNNENSIYWAVNFYKSLDSEFIDSKDLFKSDLDSFAYNTNNLILSDITDYYYLFYQIPSTFYNIKSLVINSTIIMQDILQYLLDNLAYLEGLELIGNRIYKRIEDSNNSINWPTNLKKLELGLNLVGYIDERTDEIILRPSKEFDDDFSYLSLYPKEAPYLILLDYMPSFYDDAECYDLLEFLRVNQNVQKLYIRVNRFNHDIFNFVKSYQNLIYLELSDLDLFSIINIELIDSQICNNLRSLNICLHHDNGFLHILTQQFPNLTSLTLKSIELEFNNLCSHVSKFQNLETFILEDYWLPEDSKELKFENFKNLLSFELSSGIAINFNEFNFNIDTSPKLKLVKFSRYSYHHEFDMPKLSPELEKNWQLGYFPRKLSFYRINQ